MPDIVLTTLNAKYIHAAFGLRYLMANMGDLAGRTTICEFDINQRPIEIVEKLLAQNARVIGFGVYIWNTEQTLKVVSDIRRLRPQITIVLGGPEVSYETDQQEIASLADYVIRGEADLAFADLCQKLLAGSRPLMRVIDAELPEFEQKETNDERRVVATHRSSLIALPYSFYSDHDIAHRVMYVEASRGCPFKCEFCLSSLDVPVRNAPLDQFLGHMQRLLDRGAKQFKFVDRTFNLNLKISVAILQFFLSRYEPGLFIHFEMIPDRLPEQLRSLIAKFPPGALQFEVGIQTFNTEVEKLISRKQDHARLDDNLTWLRDHTGVHVHADLIVGLPGEDIESFGRGFDRLLRLRPQEIQVGMLKRLRGTPIVRHDAEWGMVYSPHPPYEILETKMIPFDQMQRMRRFSRYWDLVANSGKLARTTELLLLPLPAGEGWGEGVRPDHGASNGQSPLTLTLSRGERGPFDCFFDFSNWLHRRAGERTHGIALHDLTEFCREYLILQGVDHQVIDQAIKHDQNPRRREASAPKRQAQHLKAI
ncbi:MAG: B12-binding domain-containing radical SAM protein [Burkholderiales bacterium]|nr:B12-binding domain-containing radical SAM protein [Phycisphaerae bacterium]